MTKFIFDFKRNHCDYCYGFCNIITRGANQIDVSVFEKMRNVRVLAANESLLPGVDLPGGFFSIIEGHLLLQLQFGGCYKTVKICGPGEVIGMGHWFINNSYQFCALESTTLCYFEKGVFTELMRSNPEASVQFLQYFAEQLHHRELRVAALQNISVKNRVCSVLFSLSKKFGVNSKDGLVIGISVSRKVISELCGTSVESLSRVISELQEDLIIERLGRKIIILDVSKLLRLATN